METEKVAEQTVYRIPSWRLDYLKKRMARLQARARKLGCSEPQLVDLGYEDVERTRPTLDGLHEKTGIVDRYHKFEIKGEAPAYGGWTFVAAVDVLPEVGNMVRVAPGQSLPLKYRTEAPHCDQCRSARNRINHYVVRSEEGEYRMVGSGCIKDFLGHESPEHIIRMAQYWSSLGSEMDEAMNGGGAGSIDYLDLEDFLSYAACSIRLNGWLSAGRAYEEDRAGQATKSLAMDGMFHRIKDCRDGCLHPTADDRELAKKSIDWARDITVASDFDHNLKVLAQSAVMPYKGAGIAAAMVYCYKLVVEKEILREKTKASGKDSQHVGVIGQRLEMLLTLTYENQKDGQWGTTYIYKFVDEAGNQVTWFSSTGGLEVGKTYRVKGTVKSHDEFRGVKQTIITRCKAKEDK